VEPVDEQIRKYKLNLLRYGTRIEHNINRIIKNVEL